MEIAIRRFKTMILCILQARTSSSRLPGKVLMPILGVPMLLRQIERIKRSKLIKKLIVATSSTKSDDVLEELCVKNNIPCYRGNLDDVLDRFYQATKQYNPKHVVRLTGDCPLIDPKIIDQVVEFHLENNFDYTSNTIEPTYPDGLDVEVFRFECLEHAWQEAKLSSQREHVTPFIHSQPNLFDLGSFKNTEDLSHFRWTVDELPDFELVSIIYKNLYSNNPKFTTADVLSFLSNNPHVFSINSQYKRNEGYQKSLALDTIIKEGK